MITYVLKEVFSIPQMTLKQLPHPNVCVFVCLPCLIPALLLLLRLQLPFKGLSVADGAAGPKRSSPALLVRSAGSSAKVLPFDGSFCVLKMPSQERRMIHASCRAVIGVVGNSEHNKGVLGKAGRSFHKGKRPIVRGSAMNPVDHPHGGGEGRTSIGRIPVTLLKPWTLDL